MLFQLTGDYAGPPVISPDGTAVVFAAIDASGRRQLWLRRLDSLAAEPLPGTEEATFPFWAPDSRAVGFFADAKLKRIDMNAGSALTLCDAPSGRGGSWNAQGTILFTPTVIGGMHQVSASGGSPVAVTSTDGTPYTSHRWPQFLPDGRHFLYLGVQQEEGRDQSAVFIGSLGGRDAAAGAAIAQPGDLRRRPAACSCATAPCGRSPSTSIARRLAGRRWPSRATCSRTRRSGAPSSARRTPARSSTRAARPARP